MVSVYPSLARLQHDHLKQNGEEEEGRGVSVDARCAYSFSKRRSTLREEVLL